MSLAVLVEGASHAHAVAAAADKVIGKCGLTLAPLYLGTRAAGVVLDAFTVGLGIYTGERVLALVFGAHFVVFRAPMLLVAPVQCGKPRSTRQIRGLGEDPNAETFWKGSFFSLFSRVQYEGWSDRVVRDNASFFFVSLALFAALMAVDVGTFALVFLLKFRKELRRSYDETHEKVPESVSVTLGVQGAVTLGGILANFAAYHVMVQRRARLVAADQRQSPLLAAAGPGRSMPGDSSGSLASGDGGSPCCSGGCSAAFAGPCGNTLVSLGVACGYVAFAVLSVGFFVVGLFFFWAFVKYYF